MPLKGALAAELGPIDLHLLDDTTGKLVKSVSGRRDGVKKRRFTEQQIIGFLKEAEAGVALKDLCRKHGFSDAAFYGWRSKWYCQVGIVRLSCEKSTSWEFSPNLPLP